jgi:hypothetical protein
MILTFDGLKTRSLAPHTAGITSPIEGPIASVQITILELLDTSRLQSVASQLIQLT